MLPFAPARAPFARAITCAAAFLIPMHAASAQSSQDTTTRVDHSMHDMNAMQGMHMTSTLGIPMSRAASGTAWIPDAISLPTHESMNGNWDVMVHGFAHALYNRQSGTRGDSQFGSINWGMLMASRDAFGGQLELRAMLSLDPLTVGNRGYPLLLQSGESFRGQALHDRQHPHDAFMELGASYSRALSENLAWQLYVAPSGEPALGSVAFMHRPSGMDNPIAPIGHHWQDATHVSFGVVTAGVFSRRWKLEGSIFNAREPDENRWNIELASLDSYSGRITFNPGGNWSVSSGFGYLHDAEREAATGMRHSMHRTTFAVQHGKTFANNAQWASTVIWSRNTHGAGDQSGSVLMETELSALAHNTVFVRAERVEKSFEDLVIGEEAMATDPAHRTPVMQFTLGYVRELLAGRSISLGLGASGTLNVIPRELVSAYGSRTPSGMTVFARVRANGGK